MRVAGSPVLGVKDGFVKTKNAIQIARRAESRRRRTSVTDTSGT